MKQKFLSYYENYSWFGSYAFLGHALFARSRLRRLSLLNRQKDYLRLSSNPELFLLHRKLNQHLLEQSDNWEDYDYGEGYFYQSLDSIGITGFRDTKARVEAMALKDFLKSRLALSFNYNDKLSLRSLLFKVLKSIFHCTSYNLFVKFREFAAKSNPSIRTLVLY